MKNILLFLLFGGLIALSSCATIIKGGKSKTIINSDPPSTVTIYDGDNEVVFTGKTPIDIPLKKGKGFFKKASYKVVFESDNYQTKSILINSESEPWVWGNLIAGGLLGLIIDGATGAIYKLDKQELNPTLKPAEGKEVSDVSLRIMDITDLPSNQLKYLTQINKENNL